MPSGVGSSKSRDGPYGPRTGIAFLAVRRCLRHASRLYYVVACVQICVGYTNYRNGYISLPKAEVRLGLRGQVMDKYYYGSTYFETLQGHLRVLA